MPHNAGPDYSSDSQSQLRNQGYASDTGYRSSRGLREHGISGYSSDAAPSGRIVDRGGYSSDAAPSGRIVDRVGYASDATEGRSRQNDLAPVEVVPVPFERGESGRSGMSALSEETSRSPVSPEPVLPPDDDLILEDDGANESFKLKGALWKVYESEGYPYYLRMQDNHSQWDDPRSSGVEGAEASTSSPEGDVGASDGENFEEVLVDTPPADPSLLSPTATSNSRAGIGATFINVSTLNSQPKKSPKAFVSSHPIHANTKHAPLQKAAAPRLTAEEVFAASSMSEPKKSSNPLEKMLQAKTGGGIVSDPPSTSPTRPPPSPDDKEIKKESPGCERIAESKDELKDDPDMAKYVRMASVGVPAQNVAMKMLQDGIPEVKIKKFREAFGLAIDHTKRSESADGVNEDDDEEDDDELENEGPVPTKEELFEDADMIKYMKMAKMGIPPQSVTHKMKQEAVSDAKIRLFERCFGIAEPLRKSKRAKKKVSEPIKRRTTVKMQKVHWNAISEEKLEGSVWGAGAPDDDDLAHDDIKELEGLFGEAKTGERKPQQNGGRLKGSGQEVNLVDAKRAYNVNIGLAQFKGEFGNDYKSLVDAVFELNGTRLSFEKVNNLKTMLPTDLEVHRLLNWNGDAASLGKCERFFLEVGKAGLKDMVGALKVFGVVGGFDEIVGDVDVGLAKLGTACEEVVGSANLGTLLKKVLAVGNLMNESVGKPKASGITLDSLLKIANTKGKDKRTTVLDYVVKMVGDKGDESGMNMLKIGRELKGLPEGARAKGIKDQGKIVDELRVGVNFVQSMSDKEGMRDTFTQRAADFVNTKGRELNDLEGRLAQCTNKVKALCAYFAEDMEKADASNVMRVLMQFAALVAKSVETYERKKRLSRGPNTPTKAQQSSQFSSSRGGRQVADFNQSLLKQAMDKRRTSMRGGGDGNGGGEGWSPNSSQGGSPAVRDAEFADSKESEEKGDSSSDEEWDDAKS